MRDIGIIGRAAVYAAIVLACQFSAARDAPADPAATAATEFAAAFFQGRDETLADRVTPQVAAAMTPAQTTQLRAGLAAQNGAFRKVGTAWHEDDVQGFSRYRVPIVFETATIDMRVVLDAGGKVAGLFFVAHVEPPGSREEPEAPVRESAVEVGEPSLEGTLSIPDGDGPFPGLVLVHGSGPNDRDGTVGPNKPLRDLAWGLAERGIAVLRYDKRTHARAADLAKLGDSLTVREEVLEDAWAALKVLRARPEVDASRVYVLGHSLGGTLAPRIAAAEPRPTGVIVLAGMTLPLPEKILEQTRYIVEQSGDRSEATAARVAEIEAAVHRVRRALEAKGPAPDGPVLGVPLGYYRDLEAHDPPAELAALPLRALVLQGGRDYQVTMDDFALWQAALKGSDRACLKVFDELDHLFRSGSGPSTPADYERPAPLSPVVLETIAVWVRQGECR